MTIEYNNRKRHGKSHLCSSNMPKSPIMLINEANEKNDLQEEENEEHTTQTKV